MATEKKVSKEEAKKTELKLHDKVYPLTYKFKLKQNAAYQKDFKKRGPRRVAALLFMKSKTYDEAVAEFKKEITSGTIKVKKGSNSDTVSKNNVMHALRRLVLYKLLEGLPGPAAFPAPMKASKAEVEEVLKEGKVTVKGEVEYEEPKAKKAEEGEALVAVFNKERKEVRSKLRTIAISDGHNSIGKLLRQITKDYVDKA